MEANVSHRGVKRKKMQKSATARKLTHGETVAERLAHDERLMATIDRAQEDFDNKRVLTLEQFAKALKSSNKESRGRVVVAR